MSNDIRPTTLFWIVGGIFLLWNAFGCYMYYLNHTMSDAAYVEAWGPASAAVRDLFPAWGTAAFAIGVFGGLLGAVLFLMRKRIALPVFVISLIAGLISFVPEFTVDEISAAIKADGLNPYMMPIMVLGMGVIEIWVTRKKIAKGILA